MTGLDHYRKAQELLASSDRSELLAAQAHATLALVAVFAMGLSEIDSDVVNDSELDAWAREVAGTGSSDDEHELHLH